MGGDAESAGDGRLPVEGGTASASGPDGGILAETDAFLEQLAAVAESARAGGSVMDKAAALAHAQRVAAWGLREAVGLAYESGMTWRDLAEVLDMPAASLHRKFQAGGGLVAGLGSRAPHPIASSASPARPELISVEGGDRPRTDPLDTGGDRSHSSEIQETVEPATSGLVLPARLLNLFIGRDREVREIPRLLRRHRLVTLIGPGGVGKTRLAMEVAHAPGAVYQGRVLWVSLATTARDADADVVAKAVEANWRRATGGAELKETVRQAAEGGRVLLVLDNCEHLALSAGAYTRTVLGEHPTLTVLATSREALEVPGEACIRLDPLPAVPVDVTGSSLNVCPAARLFTERARLAAHGVNLAGHERLVAEICNALDGLPLAIELAARQCAVLPLTELPGQLAHQLDLTTTRPGSVIGPHLGLRAAIAWSYDLLDPVEQAVFRRLSLLPDGASALSAAVLCDGLGLRRAGVWAVLGSLAAKSLLTTSDTAPVRFGMLATIRAYGLEQLDQAGELDHTTALLLTWLTECSEEIQRNGNANLKNAVGLEEIHAFLFAADLARDGNEACYPSLALGAALLAALAGDLHTAQRLLAPLLADPRLDPVSECRAHIVACSIASFRQDLGDAAEHGRRARELADAHGDPQLRFQAWSTSFHLCDDPRAAASAAREWITQLTEIGRPEAAPVALNEVAWTLAETGHAADAAPVVHDMLEAADANPNEATLPYILHTAGVVAMLNGDLDAATDHFRRGFTAKITPPSTLGVVNGLACVAAARGDAKRALRLIAGTRAARRRTGQSERTDWWSQQVTAAYAAARAQIDDHAADAAEAHGAELNLELLIEYACTDEPETTTTDTVLTPRESSIAILVAHGHTTQQIAHRLAIAPSTVDGYLTTIRTKLGLANRAELAAWAARNLYT